jgi:hypothetical protein
MKRYHIKEEYINDWAGSEGPYGPDVVITEEDLEMIARGWEKDPAELLEQLIEIDD